MSKVPSRSRVDTTRTVPAKPSTASRRRAAVSARPAPAREPVVTDPRPRGCSSQLVRRLSRRISQHFDHIVAEAGLKTTQYSLLNHVVRLGPVRPGELARAMNLDASTLTRNLRPLIDAGWAVMAHGADDRSRLVSATAAGKVKFGEAQRVWKRAQVAFNTRIGEDAVTRLHATVNECLALLDEIATAESAAL